MRTRKRCVTVFEKRAADRMGVGVFSFRSGPWLDGMREMVE